MTKLVAVHVALVLCLAGAFDVATPEAAAGEGTLLIESEPSAAAVFVDGNFAGETPVRLPPLPAGDHRVRLAKASFLEHSEIVRVISGTARTFRVRLTARLQTATPAANALKIVVVEGDAAINVVRTKTAVAPVVEVRDRNDQPMAGVIVTFAIVGGRNTTFAGGAQTLTVTTNAVGRAAAAGLNPIGSGAVRISVQAAFQGQVAEATIAQTNVMTAAAASGAGAGSAGTGSAAAGGGHGLSAATIGAIGAAAAGGAVFAVKQADKVPEAEQPQTFTLSGSFTGPLTLTFTGGNGCTRTHLHSGTVTANITVAGNSVTGTAAVAGSSVVVAVTCTNGPQLNSTDQHNSGNTPVTGASENLVFQTTVSNPFPPSGSAPGGINAQSFGFAGTLTAGVITGTLTYERTITSPGVDTGHGSASFPVTLK